MSTMTVVARDELYTNTVEAAPPISAVEVIIVDSETIACSPSKIVRRDEPLTAHGIVSGERNHIQWLIRDIFICLINRRK